MKEQTGEAAAQKPIGARGVSSRSGKPYSVIGSKTCFLLGSRQIPQGCIFRLLSYLKVQINAPWDSG